MKFKCQYCEKIWEEEQLDGEKMCPQCYSDVFEYTIDQEQDDNYKNDDEYQKQDNCYDDEDNYDYEQDEYYQQNKKYYKNRNRYDDQEQEQY